MSELISNALQYRDAGISDFDANAVAWQNGD
jgi:hypothetical protein